MKLPPFELVSFGRVRFQCLAYCAVFYGKHQPSSSASRSKAVCGLYFTQATSRPQYWLKVFRDDRSQLAGFPAGYSRQGIASALLTGAVYHKILPSSWRLFPLERHTSPLPRYSKLREQLADLMWPYRMASGVGLDIAKLVAEPLFEVIEDQRFFPIGISAPEDREFEAQVRKHA